MTSLIEAWAPEWLEKDWIFASNTPHRALREAEGFLSRLARFYLAGARHGAMPSEIRSLAVAVAGSRSGSDFKANALSHKYIT